MFVMQLNRRNYKKVTYAMPSYTYIAKHKEEAIEIHLARPVDSNF